MAKRSGKEHGHAGHLLDGLQFLCQAVSGELGEELLIRDARRRSDLGAGVLHELCLDRPGADRMHVTPVVPYSTAVAFVRPIIACLPAM